MHWGEINSALVNAMVVVLIARIVIVAGYGRGTSLLLTFFLPTGALLVLFLRDFADRSIVALTTPDWTLAVVLALLLVTQAIAALHAWLPPPMRGEPESIPVHDAEVAAKLDAIERKITTEQDEP